ncbi:hypothetical protein NC796_18540 [Aliifodinibius sp. S!AR15-10]|uniref:hypothetical protein n=1 Tax=Aliifodinibius sp. S!AR15-10 TaxID=2950437 RepID=UPI002858689B|nr:hypothetical protein [Aliifodinibius sp. S!AR15-10]MDR8393160.1 hypothetical protein [Aliifodinibius sp. S!AR15-10]
MKRLLLILTIAAGLTISGCGSEESDHTHGKGADHTHETEQHSHDGSETADATHTHSESEDAHSHSGGGSGTMLGPNETYDEVRRGIRLTLSYNSETGSFNGTVENTTQEALPQVSVGVELSNGTELGPTTPVHLETGESQSVELDAAGETFDSWIAHSEIGSSNGHSHGEDGDHEHHN